MLVGRTFKPLRANIPSSMCYKMELIFKNSQVKLHNLSTVQEKFHMKTVILLEIQISYNGFSCKP